ncbi:hypothetical protein [Streptomyces caatingaensis]|uniref:hypothetical protein n=1 Tax=Streptomyces caatingaensis TaxID=1678637 RepID=UPI0012FEA8BE|nr:hypothetical protein [Streptomyces caatingaensis]
MSEGKRELRGSGGLRSVLFAVGALVAAGLLAALAWWLGWLTPGTGWLSAKLAAKAAVVVPLGVAALITWIKKRR